MTQLPVAITRIMLYPFAGMAAFVFLSFLHDGFRTDRSIDTFFLPIGVGLTVGTVIGLMQNRIETKTRAYERQLSKEREDAALGRAAATIAHEVRNPLNALGMGLQRLQFEAHELAPEHHVLITLMLDSVDRANGIISGLLRYARPQKPVMKLMRLDLLAEDILSLYLHSCQERGIRVTRFFECHESIWGDRSLLSQVMENLIRNAIEAQPRGGILELEVKRLEHEVALVFRNHGFLLPSGEIDRIFEPYFTTKAQGTGLGLSIARGIVEAHGAKIEANVTGSGIIELTLYFPLPHPLSDVKSCTEADSAP
jgi:two-component system, NtrC family, sensor histidine kinase HydH